MTKGKNSPNKHTGTKIGGVVAAVIAAVFALEGGYVNNPKDPGGETNHGVTKEVARKSGYDGAMRDLPKEMAESIYFEDYIKKPGFLPLVETSPALGEKVVDIGVNAGPARAGRWLQTSLNALNRGGKDYADLTVDGKVGPATIKAYQSLVSQRGHVTACELVLKAVEGQQTMHYLNLTHMETFTVGWLDHRIGNVPLTRCGEKAGG